MRTNVKKVTGIVLMMSACIALTMHWGMMGIVASGCVYGLWASITKDEE